MDVTGPHNLSSIVLWPHRLTIEPLTLCTCEAGSGKKKSDAGRNCQ